MKKTLARITSMLLALALCISMLVMPASAATTYTDVATSSWYYNAVTYCTDKGYMSGYGNGTFGPTDTLTRAMFVQVLYAMSEDYGTYTGKSTVFTDVNASAWYAPAVAWALDNGITSGTSATTFSPNAAVTREQMATLVANYLNACGISLAQSDDAVDSFNDASSVSSWAEFAVDYMRLTGIISGSGGLFRPKDTATRAEAATIFWKLDLAIQAVMQNNDDENMQDSDSDKQDSDSEKQDGDKQGGDSEKQNDDSDKQDDTHEDAQGDDTACIHDYVAVSNTATCTAKGIITYVCSECGDTLTMTAPATGHSYGFYVVTTAATCTFDGVKTTTCENCGATKTATIAKTGHSYAATSTDATCTTPGSVTYTCSSCGDSYTETGSYADHAYTAVVTAPTCSEQGYTTYTCTSCGDSYVSDYTDATGEHDYGAYVTTTCATCTTAGVQTSTCSVCGATKTAEIPATGHNEVTTEAILPPDCTAEGWSDGWMEFTTYCATCGEVLSYVYYVIDAGHTYNEVTVVEPTCTEGGYIAYTCTVCGGDYKEYYADALGHSYTSEVIDAATCETTGVMTYTCSCGDSYTETIEALGHKWSAVREKHYVCNGCGYYTRTEAEWLCSACTSEEENVFDHILLTHNGGASWTCKTVTVAYACSTCGVEITTEEYEALQSDN